jgi:hypothetical protein
VSVCLCLCVCVSRFAIPIRELQGLHRTHRVRCLLQPTLQRDGHDLSIQAAGVDILWRLRFVHAQLGDGFFPTGPTPTVFWSWYMCERRVRL